MQIDGHIVASSLFRIDIPSSCQHVRLGTKLTRMEMDDKVELRKVFGPPDLVSSEEFGCGK